MVVEEAVLNIVDHANAKATPTAASSLSVACHWSCHHLLMTLICQPPLLVLQNQCYHCHLIIMEAESAPVKIINIYANAVAMNYSDATAPPSSN